MIYMPNEFHISGLWNALMFWGGFFVGFIGLFVYKASNIVGFVMWFIGMALVILALRKNIQDMKVQKGLSIMNIVLKIFFLLILIILMIVMNFI